MATPKNPTKKLDLTQELGVSGLKAYGGFVSEEFLPELRGNKALAQFRQMANNDAVVGAMLFAMKMLARQAEWYVTAADDSSAADDAEDFVEQVLFEDLETPWSDVVSEALTMLEYGFAPMEMVYQRRKADGKIGLRKLALRAQDSIQRWDMDDAGVWHGFWQQPPSGSLIYIPEDRLVLFRTEANRGNPEGRSILRNAWRSWKLKTRIEEIEGIGVERDLAGLPVVRVPGRIMESTATPDERTQLGNWEDLAKNIKRDRQEGIVLPNDRDESGHYYYDVTLLSTGGSRQFDTSAIIDRYDRRIAATVLADFIFLGQGSTGSWALSSDKTALFAVALGSFLNIIRDQINRVLLPRLWAINGMKPETMPMLEHGDVETPNLSELGNYISNLSRSGMMLFPDQPLENTLRKMAGLPEAPEREDGDEGMDPMALLGLDAESPTTPANGLAKPGNAPMTAD
jgi:hypothetical protein